MGFLCDRGQPQAEYRRRARTRGAGREGVGGATRARVVRGCGLAGVLRVAPLPAALLLARGLEPRTHAESVHVFNTHFVRPGLFDPSHNRVLAGLQRSRELADYDAAVQFSERDAGDLLAEARAFGDAVEAFLRTEGLHS